MREIQGLTAPGTLFQDGVTDNPERAQSSHQSHKFFVVNTDPGATSAGGVEEARQWRGLKVRETGRITEAAWIPLWRDSKSRLASTTHGVMYSC